MRAVPFLAAVLVATALTSCAIAPHQGYEGDQLADSETSLITIRSTETAVAMSTVERMNEAASTPSRGVSIFVSDVDHLDIPLASQVRVLPGNHCLILQVREPAQTGAEDWLMCFAATVGRAYQVNFSAPIDRPLRIWLVDQMTGQIVTEASLRPQV